MCRNVNAIAYLGWHFLASYNNLMNDLSIDSCLRQYRSFSPSFTFFFIFHFNRVSNFYIKVLLAIISFLSIVKRFKIKFFSTVFYFNLFNFISCSLSLPLFFSVIYLLVLAIFYIFHQSSSFFVFNLLFFLYLLTHFFFKFMSYLLLILITRRILSPPVITLFLFSCKVPDCRPL